MSRHAAIHGALGLIVTRGQCGFRLRRGRTVVMVLVHRTVTVVRRHGMAGSGLPCPGARRRHNRREHGGKQGRHNRDG